MLISLAEHMKPIKALSRPHKGIVLANNDPKKLGRVKVQIEGLLEGAADVLPWVPTILDPSKFDVPEVGDELYIVFPFNSIYFPFSLGYWHSELNHNGAFDDNYPNTFGVAKQGFILKYNKESKVGDFVHPSGTTGKVIEDGSLTFNIAKDLDFTLEGKLTVTATGDVSFTTDGKITLVGKGGIDYTTDAQAIFSGKGGTTIGDSSSTTMVNGTTVLIAGGGVPVAMVGATAIGPGNLGAPVVCTIIQGSSKVLVAP